MYRTIVIATVLAVGALEESTASPAMGRDDCRIAAAEAGPARRALLRRRGARANRNGRGAQSFPAAMTEAANETPPIAAVLEATPPAVSQLHRQGTEVWPQAAALFPAE
ncbi:MAG: hypothetical protein WD894_02640 [Pirellulales bacterium]